MTLGVEVDRHLARGLAREDLFRQDFVGAGDLRSAHDQADAVLFGQRDGDLQRGVAGADDEDVLLLMLRRIDEAVANVRQVFARAPSLRGLPCVPIARTTLLAVVLLAGRGLADESARLPSSST